MRKPVTISVAKNDIKSNFTFTSAIDRALPNAAFTTVINNHIYIIYKQKTPYPIPSPGRISFHEFWREAEVELPLKAIKKIEYWRFITDTLPKFLRPFFFKPFTFTIEVPEECLA